MKKYIQIMLLFMAVLNITRFSIHAKDETSRVVPIHHVDGVVSAAEILPENFDKFYSFVKTSEPDIFDISTLWYQYKYIHTDDGQDMIERTCPWIKLPLFYKKGDSPGAWSLAYHNIAGSVDFEMLNYFAHTNNIQEWLSKNEIEGTVKDYLILTLTRYLPPFIWVDTDQGDYYILLEKAEEGEPYNEMTGENQFTCEVYDSNAMLAAIDSIYEKAKLPVISIFVNIHDLTLEFDTPPRYSGGRVIAPVRVLAKRLGATVEWNEDVQTATVIGNETTIEFKIGSKTAIVNGKRCEMDSAPELIDNRTLVPVRFMAETLGYYVKWYGDDYIQIYNHYVPEAS